MRQIRAPHLSFIAHRLPGWRMALFLCLALLLGVPGCGGDATPTPSRTTTTTSSPSSPSTAPSASGIQLNPPGTLPLVNEKATLRVVLLRDDRIASYEYGENAVTTWLEDRTGVHAEFILLPENLGMLSSMPMWVEEYDVFLGPIDRCLADFYGVEQLMPLASLIDQYAWHLAALEVRISWLRSAMTAPDGQIYALPLAPDPDLLDPNAIGMRMWIHRGFLEAYGQGMPATVEEFRSFLEWVRDADANGNGDPEDEIGWTGAERPSVYYARPTDFLMNAFVLQNPDGFAIRDDTVRCALVEDGYREGLRYLNGLMEAGLMDTEYPSHDPEYLRARVEQGNGDTVACVSSCLLSALSDDPVVQAKYVCMPPLSGPDGSAYTYYDPFAGVRFNSLYVDTTPDGGYRTRGSAAAMISRDCADPGLAMAWLDALYDPEVLLRASFGEKDVDWRTPPEGTVAVDGCPAKVEILRDRWTNPVTGFWGESFPLRFQGNNIARMLLPADDNPVLVTEYQAARMYEPYIEPCALLPFAYDRDTQIQVNEWRTNIGDYDRGMITA
ncbi:MAG: hypothetical protein GX153_11765, partial [Clostridiaceae bacterium]|nr:hypothetical protein [Clostridiaceae bacterium]